MAGLAKWPETFGPTQVREAVRSVVVRQYWAAGLVSVWTLGMVLLGFIASRLIDLNKFSLHGTYRNRLVRAYLGASRTRDPNPFTGFDPEDNLPIKNLRDLLTQPKARAKEGANKQPEGPWRPPLHVINMALNLVASQNLAGQDRKAESFTVSPLHAGSAALGYRKSADYTGHDGVTLGTAMAISGAAVSPNMGYHSSPAIAFLLTLFNVRLGWWWGNPGPCGQDLRSKPPRDFYRDAAPRSAAAQVFAEAFGQTDETHPYVYLSDGGHFDNLGVYEMVRRRCHRIVVSDAGADESFAFDDLGNAMRRVYMDMGVEIRFSGAIRIYPRKPEPKLPRQGFYCAVASIDYRRADGDAARQGELIYIKRTLYGQEPADIRNYAQSCASFPHETTANQFFTETQFESYRGLGQFIGSALYPPESCEGDEDGFIAGPRAHLRMPYIREISPATGGSDQSLAKLDGIFAMPASNYQLSVRFGSATARTAASNVATRSIEVAPPPRSGTGAVDVTVAFLDPDGTEYARHTRYDGYTYS
jgi:hypothetical protein